MIGPYSYPNSMYSTNAPITGNPELEKKLRQIATLEEEHDLLGCSIKSKDSGAVLTTSDAVDFVLASTQRAADILSRKDEISVPDNRAP